MRELPTLALFIGLISLPTFASAQQASMLTGVDAMSATVLQEGQSSFSGLGLRVRLHPERLVPDLELMPTIEYWRNSSTVPPYNIRATRRDGTLGMDARYMFHPHGWQPYVGAGFGIHFLSSRVSAPAFGLNDASDSVIKGGLAALAGVNFGLSKRLDNFIELKYHHIPDYRQLKINWGLAFRM
jgi:hypothetical protein